MKPQTSTSPAAKKPQTGFPGARKERQGRIRRFLEQHRNTIRRLGE